MIRIHSYPVEDLPRSISGLSVQAAELACWWLGQAGFVLKSSNSCCVIDPYLSDSLAQKYAGTTFPHRRLTPIPVAPAALESLTGILCTHHHSDHLDPGTLPPLLQANPSARLIAPRACMERLELMGLKEELSDPVNPHDQLTVGDFSITVVPASHETMEVDQEGNHRFVGYVMEAAGIRVYHSGDCIPFEGQTELLRTLDIDLALLPINGRDEHRSSSGIPGNFTVEEAVRLCEDAGIGHLLCHHFEMFDFNTVERDSARRMLQEKATKLEWLLPELQNVYVIQSASTI